MMSALILLLYRYFFLSSLSLVKMLRKSLSQPQTSAVGSPTGCLWQVAPVELCFLDKDGGVRDARKAEIGGTK